MALKLAPVINSAGQLLGHLDLNRCYRSHDGYVVDETVANFGKYMVVKTTAPADTVRFFRFPINRMKFRWDQDEQTVRYLTVDEPIPQWVWKVAGIKFSGPGDWEGE